MNKAELMVKAEIYRLFSRILDYPYDDDVPLIPGRIELLQQLLSNAGEKSLGEAIRLLEEAKEAFRRELGRLGRDEFQASYVSTFELGLPRPPCPPLESSYIEPGEVAGSSFIEVPGAQSSPRYLETKSMLDVLASLTALYEASGVKVREASPDHISVELEFAAYLLEKAAEKESEESLNKYASFIHRLSRWVPRLSECLAKHSELQTYVYLVRALDSFIKAEEGGLA